MARKTKKTIVRYIPLTLICILMLLNLLNHFFALLPKAKSSVGFQPVDCPNVTRLDGIPEPAKDYNAFSYEPKEMKLELFKEYGGGVKVSFMWGGQLFDKSSYTYDHDLFLAADSIINYGIWTYLNYSGDEEVYEKAMGALGFTHTETMGEATYNVDKPEMHISSLTTTFPSGERVLVNVNVRGSFSFGDYTTNLKSVNDGFEPPARYVRDNVLDYMERNYPDVPKENVILFITGHSLGGACSGLQAPLMEEAGFLKEQTFIYTLASPKYRTYGKSKEFQNVFNIIVDRDLIPKVPLLDGHYGNDIRFESVFVGTSLMGMVKSAIQGKTGVIPTTVTGYHSVLNYLQSADSGRYSQVTPARRMLMLGGELFLNSVQIALY